MAAAGRRRPRGPGAAGCSRPPPARSSGRPAQDGGVAGWSSQASAYKSGWCAHSRTCECRLATPGPSQACQGRPTTATAPSVGGSWRGCARPGRAGWCRARSAVVLWCRGQGGGVAWGAARSRRSRSRCRTGRPGIPGWRSGRARWSGRRRRTWRRGGGAGRRRRAGVVAGRHKAAVRAQPHQHRHGQVGQVQRQLRGVVAGVEHNPWDGPARGQASQQRAELGGGGLVGVLQGVEPAGIHRGGPGVPRQAQLADPLERPAGDDRLAGRVARRVVVVAAFGRALGVAARPGGHIDRED
jgi:hypothetical protein